MNKVTGIVKWFNDAKGYGFIDTVEVKNIFVHYSAINVEHGFRTLGEDDLVEFNLETGAKGPQAFQVVRITPKNNTQSVILFLKKERSKIVFESEDDEGAMDYYGHISDVIEQLEKNEITVEEAGASLGMNL